MPSWRRSLKNKSQKNISAALYKTIACIIFLALCKETFSQQVSWDISRDELFESQKEKILFHYKKINEITCDVQQKILLLRTTIFHTLYHYREIELSHKDDFALLRKTSEELLKKYNAIHGNLIAALTSDKELDEPFDMSRINLEPFWQRSAS